MNQKNKAIWKQIISEIYFPYAQNIEIRTQKIMPAILIQIKVPDKVSTFCLTLSSFLVTKGITTKAGCRQGNKHGQVCDDLQVKTTEILKIKTTINQQQTTLRISMNEVRSMSPNH